MLPPDVSDKLREAGWFPGRRVPSDELEGWKSRLAEFSIFPAAEAFLSEFGGLHVQQSGAGVEKAREPFEFLPTRAWGETERFAEYEQLLGTKLYPLGEFANGHYFLAISQSGHVYLVMEDLRLLGDSTEHALTALVRGLKSKKVA